MNESELELKQSHIEATRQMVILNYVTSNGRDPFIDSHIDKFYKHDLGFQHEIQSAERRYNILQREINRNKEVS